MITKLLIILVVLLVVVALIAIRYRRQITMGLQILKMFRQMRKVGKSTPENKIDKSNNSKDVALVRCERCGKWTPQSEAMNLRSNNFYCSPKCMERAAKLQSMVD